MEENDKGCPRCRDYDKVREELENSKRKSTEDQKNALKRCEDSKAQLQKKLLTVGAAAVIGGTILGKDMVDKIAEYINSFNKVKDAASGLVSMAPPPVIDTPVEVKEETKEEDEEEKSEDDTKTLDVPFTGYPLDSMLADSTFTPSGMYDVISMTDIQPSFISEMLQMQTEPVEQLNLSDLIAEFTSLDTNEIMVYMPNIEDAPRFLDTPPVTTVPSTSTMSVMILPALVRGRRRRR